MKKVLVVDNGSSYISNILALLDGYSVTQVDYRSIPDDIHIFIAVILSGGHSFPVLKHEQYLSKEIHLIKNFDGPILGICYGFELIADVFGAKLQKLIDKEKGVMNISRNIDDPIFSGINTLNVFENHRWVVNEPGPHLIGLASSRDGIEIIKHKQKPIYGMQFHPEMFVNKLDGDELFANFLKIAENSAV